jgi:hypothetical protein
MRYFNPGDRVTYPGRGEGVVVVCFRDPDLPSYVQFDGEKYPQIVDYSRLEKGVQK